MSDETTVERNAVHCLTCNTTIESKHRRDWVICNCGNKSDTYIYIDGGNEYRRMGCGEAAIWEDLSKNG